MDKVDIVADIRAAMDQDYKPTQKMVRVLLKEYDRLTALCDGYRGERDAANAICDEYIGEVDRLTDRLAEYKRDAQKYIRRESDLKSARDRAESKVIELEARCKGYAVLKGITSTQDMVCAECREISGETAESALTRARAEGMEEAAKIAAEMPTPGYADDSKRDGYEAAKEDIAAAVRARAAKGDSDEG